MQQTIAVSTQISGIGLHSGADFTITFHPAPINHGIIFFTEVQGIVRQILAVNKNIICTKMCSEIGNDHFSVATIEHLMAALWALKIDNIAIVIKKNHVFDANSIKLSNYKDNISINKMEIPALDGSSKPFINIIEKSGILVQNRRRQYLMITKEIALEDESGAMIQVRPRNDWFVGISINFTIDFPNDIIGLQQMSFDEKSQSFYDEISAARTFGSIKDAAKLHSMGLALGASPENVVLLDEDKVLNEEGLRFSDEFVRHKILDFIGDCYLSGYRIIGHFNCYKAGHKVTADFIKEMITNRTDCYELV